MTFKLIDLPQSRGAISIYHGGAAICEFWLSVQKIDREECPGGVGAGGVGGACLRQMKIAAILETTSSARQSVRQSREFLSGRNRDLY